MSDHFPIFVPTLRVICCFFKNNFKLYDSWKMLLCSTLSFLIFREGKHFNLFCIYLLSWISFYFFCFVFIEMMFFSFFSFFFLICGSAFNIEDSNSLTYIYFLVCHIWVLCIKKFFIFMWSNLPIFMVFHVFFFLLRKGFPRFTLDILWDRALTSFFCNREPVVTSCI